MDDDASITLCVPSVGRAGLPALLASARRSAELADARLDVVVALAPGARSVAGGDGVRIVPNAIGAAWSGRNAAAEVAAGHWLAFVDDDVTLAPSWHERASAALRESGAFAAFAGMTRRLEGASALDRAWRAAGFTSGFAVVERLRWLRWAPSSNLIVRRDVFGSVGGFAALPIAVGGEDVDLGMRLVAAGWGPMLALRDVVVEHAPLEGDDEHGAAAEALVAKARDYGRAEQEVARRHPGWRAGRPALRAFHGADLRGRLVQAFASGRRAAGPPATASTLRMADALDPADGRPLLVEVLAHADLDATRAAIERAGGVLLDERAGPGEGRRLLAFARSTPPWGSLSLPGSARRGDLAAWER